MEVPPSYVLPGLVVQSLGLDILSQAKKSRVALARIEECRDTVTQKADEKISVVTDVYTLVDEHIQFLGGWHCTVLLGAGWCCHLRATLRRAPEGC